MCISGVKVYFVVRVVRHDTCVPTWSIKLEAQVQDGVLTQRMLKLIRTDITDQLQLILIVIIFPKDREPAVVITQGQQCL